MNTTYFFKFFSFCLLLICSASLAAQSSMGGNMMIAENASMTIYSQHDFAAGNGFITPGMIHTTKTGNKGYLVFEEGSSWIGANNGRFVDGFVKVKHGKSFVFPVGAKNQYRPVGISGAINTTAAYFAKSPKKPLAKITANGIDKVSDSEYWEIKGEDQTQLSLFWGRESTIASLTGGQLDQLTIVGWKNGQWRIIPSTVEKTISTSFLASSSKVKSDFDEGVITSKEVLSPNDYDYFTLASLTDKQTIPVHPGFSTDLVSVFPNPVVKELTVNIGKLIDKVSSIKIYSIDGKEMASRIVKEGAASIQRFDASNYENGMYNVHIKVNHKLHTTQFMVAKMY